MTPGKCDRCGGDLPERTGRGRPRKRHDICPQRDAAPVVQLGVIQGTGPDPAAPGELPGAGPAFVVASLVERTYRELAATGRLDTVEGVLVLRLANSIDLGFHTGSQLASLSKEYRAALVVALADADDGADEIDQIFRSA